MWNEPKNYRFGSNSLRHTTSISLGTFQNPQTSRESHREKVKLCIKQCKFMLNYIRKTRDSFKEFSLLGGGGLTHRNVVAGVCGEYAVAISRELTHIALV